MAARWLNYSIWSQVQHPTLSPARFSPFSRWDPWLCPPVKEANEAAVRLTDLTNWSGRTVARYALRRGGWTVWLRGGKEEGQGEAERDDLRSRFEAQSLWAAIGQYLETWWLQAREIGAESRAYKFARTGCREARRPHLLGGKERKQPHARQIRYLAHFSHDIPQQGFPSGRKKN